MFKMVHLTLPLTILLAGIANLGLAHPGHDVKAEAAERAAYLKGVPVQSRDLSHCASTFQKRGVENANAARREAAVDQLRRKRGLATGTFNSRSADE